jgi:hypothetical protein
MKTTSASSQRCAINPFFPLQKIVCIDEKFPVHVLEWGSDLPKKGQIYTIRWIRVIYSADGSDPIVGVVLEELNNPDNLLHFSVTRFVALYPDDEPDREQMFKYGKEISAGIGRFADFPPTSYIATF